MKRIPLSQGLFAIVDDEDYEWLSKFKWHVAGRKGYFYARRSTYIETKKTTFALMQHMILKVPVGQRIDHINHNTLDNRKANLRIASREQNRWNSRKTKRHSTSKYKGVSYHKLSERWVVGLRAAGKCYYGGSYRNEWEAAEKYDELAKEMHGRYACLNFSQVAPNSLRNEGIFFEEIEDHHQKRTEDIEWDRILKALSCREREIIKLRFGFEDRCECTLEEVGRIYKVTKERVRQLEAKALKKLCNMIKK